MKLILTVLTLFILQLSVIGQNIPSYYSDVNLQLSGLALKQELSQKITNTHTQYFNVLTSLGCVKI